HERIAGREMRRRRMTGHLEPAEALPRGERLGEDDVQSVVVHDSNGQPIDDREPDGQNDGTRDPRRHPLQPIGEPHGHASTPYRDNFRYSVDGSMPSDSAARDLLPFSLWSTQRMYARSTASRVGLAGVWAETSGSTRRSVTRSGSASTPIVSPGVRMTDRSSAFSSSRTFPGHA